MLSLISGNGPVLKPAVKEEAPLAAFATGVDLVENLDAVEEVDIAKLIDKATNPGGRAADDAEYNVDGNDVKPQAHVAGGDGL